MPAYFDQLNPSTKQSLVSTSKLQPLRFSQAAHYNLAAKTTANKLVRRASYQAGARQLTKTQGLLACLLTSTKSAPHQNNLSSFLSSATIS